MKEYIEHNFNFPDNESWFHYLSSAILSQHVQDYKVGELNLKLNFRAKEKQVLLTIRSDDKPNTILYKTNLLSINESKSYKEIKKQFCKSLKDNFSHILNKHAKEAWNKKYNKEEN